jgi:hypothetical protein
LLEVADVQDVVLDQHFASMLIELADTDGGNRRMRQNTGCHYGRALPYSLILADQSPTVGVMRAKKNRPALPTANHRMRGLLDFQ